MVGNALLPAQEEEASLVKCVQELSVNSHEPPSIFWCRDKDEVPVDASQSSLIPIIDLQLLNSLSNKEREEEMEKLRDALSSWGLFLVVSHGISTSFLDEVHKIAKDFFHLPMEEKRKYAKAGDGKFNIQEAYASDDSVSECQVINWSDRLYLLVYPEDERDLRLWPEDHIIGFREVLDEYGKKTNLITETLIKAMDKLLGLEGNHLASQFGKHTPTFARFGYYPPCSRPDLVYGFKPHSDGDGLTIILPDKEVEGLEVLKDDQWIKVPIIPHALVVNLGDQMEIMTNGIFKSPVHRVLTNAEKERISLGMFSLADVDKEIEPAAALINESRARVFKKIMVKEYLDIFFQNNMHGKRSIDWAKA